MKFGRITLAIYTLISWLAFALPALAITNGDDVPTITGSSPAAQNVYPWMAALHEGTNQINLNCGATLVGSRFAVTSAHCLDGLNLSNTFITVGGYDVSNGAQTGQRIKVSSVIIHPDFNSTSLTHDLALLVLQDDAQAVEKPIYVTERELSPGRTATIIGWGETTPCNDASNPGGICDPVSNQLLRASVRTSDRASCEAALNTVGAANGLAFDTTHICALVNASQQDACGADSGGPIFVVGPDGKPVQIGTTSWGAGCGQVGYGTAYTNLGQLIGFLLDNLGGQSAVKLLDYAVTNDQRKVAQILDQIGAAAAPGTTLRQDYGRLFMNSGPGTTRSLQSLLPTAAFEMGSMVENMVSLQSQGLKTRIRALRDGITGGQLDTSGFRLVNMGESGVVDRSTGLTGSNAIYGSPNPLRSSDVDYQAGGNDTAASTDNSVGRMYDPALYGDSNTTVAVEPAVPAQTYYAPAAPNRLTDTSGQNSNATLPQPGSLGTLAQPLRQPINGTPLAQRVNPYLGAPPVTIQGQGLPPASYQPQQPANPSSDLQNPPLGQQRSDYDYERTPSATVANQLEQPAKQSFNQQDPLQRQQRTVDDYERISSIANGNQIEPSRLSDITRDQVTAPLPLQDNTYASSRIADVGGDIAGYDADGNIIRIEQNATGAYPASLALDQVAETNSYYAGQTEFNRGAYRSAPARKVIEDDSIMSEVSRWFGGRSPNESSQPGLPRTAAETRYTYQKQQAKQYPGQPLGMYYQKMSTRPAPAAAPSSASVTDFQQASTVASPAMVSKYSYRYRQAYAAEPYQQNSATSAPPVRLGSVAVPYNAAQPATINADRRWGVFVSGDVRFGNEALLRDGARTKIDNTGFTVGVDYRVAPSSFVGAALSYAHGSFNTGGYSDVQGDGYALSLYGTTSYMKNAYVDGFLSLGYHTFDTERTIYAGNGLIRLADADPDAWHYVAEAETGYDFKRERWKFGPFAGFRLSYADFNEYQESGAGSFNLNVHNRDDFSAIGSLGVGASHQFQMDNGGVLVPSMRIAYQHEFGEGQVDVKANFLDAPNLPFKVAGARRERDWLNVNPTVSAAFPNNWLFQAYYSHDFLRYNVETHIFNLAARYKW
jgi:outer membrane autotransporter protein